MAFQFQKPRNFLFRPGQFIDLSLPGLPRQWVTVSHAYLLDRKFLLHLRHFVGYANARLFFQAALSVLPLDTEVSIEGPMGSFVLHSDVSRPAVFPAGGIGITPVLSKLFSVPIEKHQPPVFLFYANRYIVDAAFMDTLCDLEMSTGKLHFVPTFTRIVQGLGGWRGATGPINAQMLSNYISNLQDPIYYVAGPPGMVAGTHQTLVELAVRKENIRPESFAGY